MAAARGITGIAGATAGLLSTLIMTDRTTIKRIRAAIQDSDPGVRAHAVDALVTLADTAGLRAALGSQDRYVRERAVRGLAACRGWHVGLWLAAAAFDADPAVRCAVAAAFAQRRGALAARILVRLAHDPSAVVRYAAVTGLVSVRPNRARSVLRYVETHDREGWLRDTATALLQRARPATP
jgi:HEAT repeat protein